MALLSVAALGVVGAGSAAAQDLVYEPVNPNFGGNAFNSAHLLSIANAQNDYDPPETDDGRLGTSQADLFVRQLQSRLLSGLAGEVTNAIFGDNPQDSGTIQFGSQTITFQRGLTSIRITIFDAETGTTTEIEIPILNSEGDGEGAAQVPTIASRGADLVAFDSSAGTRTVSNGQSQPPALRPVIPGFKPIGPHPTGVIEIPD